jgi:hypothetical protein
VVAVSVGWSASPATIEPLSCSSFVKVPYAWKIPPRSSSVIVSQPFWSP